MKKSFLTFALLCFHLYTFAQCNQYFPLKQGSMFEMENFTAKGKSSGTVKQTVTSIEATGTGFKALMKASSYDRKGKQEHEGTFEILCQDGVARLDMGKFIPAEVFEAYENLEVEFTGEYLDLPDNLSIGQALPDGSVSMKINLGNGMGGTMDIKIINRQVAGKETVETEAGSFDCFKITYDLSSEMKMMGMSIPMNMKVIEWLAKDVGPVKTESYNKKEKLIGYTLLKDYNIGK